MRFFLLNGLGCIVLPFGVLLANNSHIATSGAAGLALTIVHVSESPFFLVFFLVNLPFFLLSYFQMGLRYTVTSAYSVCFLSLLTYLTMFVPSFSIHPFVGATLGGFFVGAGAVLIFISRSSMGGATILAVYLQQRYKVDPGIVIFLFDSIVALITLYFLGIENGLYTIVNIIVCSTVISYCKKVIGAKSSIQTAA